MSYTKEQAARILAGLLSGKRPGYHPMSQADYEARCDPQATRERRILDLLERIALALEAPSDSQPLTQQRYTEPPVRATSPPTSGTVPLE